MNVFPKEFRSVRLDDENASVVILDETALPQQEIYLQIRTAEEMFDAICKLKVRGAPAIGIAAAYIIYICMKRKETDSYADFLAELRQLIKYLCSSRPTAVNLSAALSRMENVVVSNPTESVHHLKELLHKECLAIDSEDVAACHAIGENALTLLRPGMGILTHCNAGHLATSEFGTALAPVYLGQQRGYNFHLFVDETRPLLQGARLTAYELQKAGIDATLICDNMAASFMASDAIDAVLVGCDRIARNGDVANKIGTFGVAILARYFGLPFYVLGPSSTIDMNCPGGEAIEIEERSANEVTEMWYAKRMAPTQIKVKNPAFDVTPYSLISAIITEKGVFNGNKFEPIK